MSARRRLPAVLSVLIFISAAAVFGQPAKKPFTFADVMKFRSLSEQTISSDGRWIAYTLQPDRGDGSVEIRSADGTKTYSIERGGRPVFSRDGRRLGAVVKVKAVDMEKPAKDRPKPGLAVLDPATGKIETFESVNRFAFSDDGRWLAVGYVKPKGKPAPAENPAGEKSGESGEKEPVPTWDTGRFVLLRNLETGAELKMDDVLHFAFDPRSTVLLIVRSTADGAANGMYLRDLGREGLPESALWSKAGASISAPAWAKDSSRAAFLAAVKKDKEDFGRSTLALWDGDTRKPAEAARMEAASGWTIPLSSSLSWSDDGKRLFVGLRPDEGEPTAVGSADKPDEKPVDLFDFGSILEKREVDVWHWNDPRINSQQKKQWNRTKNQTYTAVYHFDKKRLVPLASPEMDGLQIPDNPRVAIGTDGRAYEKEITWDGEYNDVYIVDLQTGARKQVLSHFGNRPILSPGGRFIAFFENKHWFLLDVDKGGVRNLTKDMPVAFYREEDDHPAPPPAAGAPLWLEDDAAVLLNDNYDVWMFATDPRGGVPVNVTAGEGRKENRSFTVLRPDPEKKFFRKGERLLLASYHNREKNHGFYEATLGAPGVRRLLEDKKKFAFRAAAKDAGTLLYTREDYNEFPDLWVADPAFDSPRKISGANPQISEFAWGKAELVDWTSADGVPLQGVLIRPEGDEPGKRYPVFVYYYELSSQRLYEFNQVVVNHRPCFPVWAGHGYAVFLPDVKFEVGRPGMSAVKCLVPGVQKLVDMGVADPNAIGLHGHSWSGYETAYVVTQTDIFAAACAGAPVGNMTSAYNGIRWESGLARQFQYEQSQSRIGASLWERRDLYIENSPVFYADRVRTPLLLMHGDEDGAVPWYQSIELYLALRRLGRDCIFLQYRGEPHHPQKYPNKLDYSIKLMEYFDHYLKGAPAADWIKTGVPYNGK
ncbi:MAG: prolyl oligopeptidase family serine peptidase [Candidatus Aminicenantes bacterium]|nr:prolyl oligopeptidase family serine peptidase [Candidatus Aminicenantes bacterium]